jgi:hypothetical protein
MPAIDNTQIANILGALTPTGTGGIPGSFTAFAASAMKIRLSSTASTASAAGTELSTQTSGYTNGTGWNSLGVCTGTGTPTVIGVPFTTQSFVSNGSPTAVQSFDLESSAGVRGFWGPFNGAPVNVASGNVFQVTGGAAAAAGIQISLT